MNFLKREILISIMLIFAWLPFAEGSGLMRSYIVEVKNVMAFEVIYPATGSTNKLNISGYVSDSAYVVKKITTTVSGDVMTINVYKSLTGEENGNIDFSVVIPESVNEVRFGTQAQKIWEREAKDKAESL